MATFTGKQIVIRTKEGEEFRYMGSAYTVRVDNGLRLGTVSVRLDGDTINWWYFSELEFIVEDIYANINI
ncbi:hypothetical protein PHB09_158 [Pseudomonas phage PHB09]|uniref:Uncharacterized protein n=1 Tax=Pseudomonas phage PHB09 TaxID=2867265 RepID=A0AAE9BNE3_9CAUD|nr:hypothetical protein QGX10_gp157 [Pseudomonas phage PHB09]UAV84653.1 hypothetical protein PHB09_158 [Pseudomonas phage PHB09]